jgi:hypothetical protein
LGSVRCALEHTRTSAQSLQFFLERPALQVGHYCGKRDMIELHPATPHIDRISPFQMYRIYQETLLQYFPNAWVSAPCSDISRCGYSAPKSPNGTNSRSFYTSPPIKYHHFRPYSDIPSPVPRFQSASGQTPTSGGRSQVFLRRTWARWEWYGNSLKKSAGVESRQIEFR